MAKIRSWSWRKRGTQSQAIGCSKGGMTTKILALTDALDNLVRFVLMSGIVSIRWASRRVIDGLAFDGFIADKAYDSNSIIADLNERGAKIVISQHPRRASPLPIDVEIYKWRHLIENFFCKLKEFKRIAMRAGNEPIRVRRKYPSRRSRDKFPMNLQQALAHQHSLEDASALL